MRIALALLVVAAVARADDGVVRLDVAVGATVEQDVMIARGWFCDDPSLVKADLVTRGDHNFWIVTGVKPGTTQCRVGTDLYRVHYVFEVRVSPARSRR